MDPSLAIRVVRGPDWGWGDQDGGEGGVGTVVEVGRNREAVLVQWDFGTRGWYRSGGQNKFDLRVLDTGLTGVKFADVVCSGCYAEGVAGMHWKCAYCYEYHLCHLCYLLGRHCQEHPFFRVESMEQNARVMVSSRVDAKRVEARGIFPGAEVVRGHNWRFGNQDGGAGKTGRVEIIQSQHNTARSVARVTWSATREVNIYRVGYKGKVDLKCTTASTGGHYFPQHLPTLGAKAKCAFFNENEIVAGDVIHIELEGDLLNTMHRAHSVGHDKSKLSDQCGLVVSRVGKEWCTVSFRDETSLTLTHTLTKLKYCQVGKVVRVTDDVAEFQKRQKAHNMWNDNLVLDQPALYSRRQHRNLALHIVKHKSSMTLGQLGCIVEVLVSGELVVAVNGILWTIHALNLSPAPEQTVPMGPVEHAGLRVNLVPVDYREMLMESGFSDALLDGDEVSLSRFLSSNVKIPTVKVKESLMCYHATKGNIAAVKVLLQHDVTPNVKFLGAPILVHCILVRQEKAAQVLVEAGADVNVNEGAVLLKSIKFRCFQLLKTYVYHPKATLYSTDKMGYDTMNYIARYANALALGLLLATKAEQGSDNPLNLATRIGSVSLAEQCLAYHPEHVNVVGSDGFTGLHSATVFNDTAIINLLASQDGIDLNATAGHCSRTPLLMAALRGYYAVVESLVGWGAFVNCVDSDGNTPLHFVIHKTKSISLSSPHLKQIHEDLSNASGNRPVEGYVAVACFLVQEGADWLINNKGGQSPYQGLSSEATTLITDYIKSHPGTFLGSLCSTRTQRIQELPERFNQTPTPGSAQESKYSARDSKKDQPPVFTSLKSDQPSQGSTMTIPNYPSHLGFQHLEQQPCMLCEEQPASVKFSPCGHTLLCSLCAQRAKKCLKCKASVQSMDF